MAQLHFIEETKTRICTSLIQGAQANTRFETVTYMHILYSIQYNFGNGTKAERL